MHKADATARQASSGNLREHDMPMQHVERELVSDDGKHKVELFRRENGSYGFRVLRWSDEPAERCWVPFGRFSECFAPVLETAEAEARSRVEWLRR